MPEIVQARDTRVFKGLEHLCYRGKIEMAGTVKSGEEEVQTESYTVYECLNRRCKEKRASSA